MTNLYEAASMHAIMRDALLAAYPELTIDDPHLLDSLEGISSFPESVKYVIRSIDEDQIIIDGIKARETELATRRERHKVRVDAKRAAIAQALERAGETKLVLPDATVSLGKSAPKVIVTDEDAIPLAYWISQPARLDRETLLKDMKAGNAVEGASLSNGGQTLVLRRK